MKELLDEVLAAHGGAGRWRSVSAITARGRLDGLLPQRFPGNKLARFFGLSGVRRNVRWDPLDTAYFAGYASCNYLTAPFLLTCDGVTVTECEPWRESGQQWRRLLATFPAHLHTHCRQQTFYVDPDGLIRRHDFVAEPVGTWARAALYCDQHRRLDGLTFPTRRRVLPRGPGDRALPRPTLLALEFDEIDIETRSER